MGFKIKQRLRLDQRRQLVIVMNRQERLDLISELRAASDRGAAEIAQRRADRLARQLAGIEPVDDYVMPDLVTKSALRNAHFDLQSALDDQQWQQRNFQAQPQQPEDQLVTVGYLDHREDVMIDATVGHIIEVMAPLIERITKLENELQTVRGIASGEVRSIAHVKAAS